MEPLSMALICLGLNVYHEGRSENLTARYAIAHVTLNRVKKKKKELCETVMEPGQFSWTVHAMRRVGSGWVVAELWQPVEPAAWDSAMMVAKHTMSGVVADPTKGATYFHRTDVTPTWRLEKEFVGRWGRHFFYKDYPKGFRPVKIVSQ